MTILSDIGFPLVYVGTCIITNIFLHFCVLIPEYQVVSLQFLIDQFYFSIGIQNNIGDILEKTFIDLQLLIYSTISNTVLLAPFFPLVCVHLVSYYAKPFLFYY
jgi:hypothetical protein